MGEAGSGATFKDMITGNRFCYGAELVTTRGFTPPPQPSKVVELGQQLLSDPRIGWVSLTDNPGGNVMLPADWLARSLGTHRERVVVHLTCKDLNRNGLESVAWKYAAEGFHNILAMTGDYPTSGYRGTASPVFDLDSVSLIELLRRMNDGLKVADKRGEITTLPRTNFYIGCVVSPFKRHERELMPQYFKLLRKISCGAQFVYTQVGYDMRKFHEVLLLLASHGIQVPVIGNAYLLNKTVAGLFHRGEIAGCVVSDKLYELAVKYSAGPDKGRGFFLDLAAKQLAAFKGLGFAGGYLGGITKAETFFEIIDRANSFGENDWREFAKEIQFPQPGEFYLFEKDPVTGLGDKERLNREYLESLKSPPKTPEVNLSYRLSRLAHEKVFTPDTAGFNLMKRFYSRWDRKPGIFSRVAYATERVVKFLWFGCKDCGDCSLPDCAYLCPLSTCSKNQRNGPCGGSSDAKCEVGEKECIWARAYDRLKYDGESEAMLKGPPVFYNAALKDTSSWANTFLGRDHFGAGAAAQSAKAEKQNDKGG